MRSRRERRACCMTYRRTYIQYDLPNPEGVHQARAIRRTYYVIDMQSMVYSLSVCMSRGMHTNELRKYIFTYVYIHIYTHGYVCIHICVYIYSYIYIYTHTQTYMCSAHIHSCRLLFPILAQLSSGGPAQSSKPSILNPKSDHLLKTLHSKPKISQPRLAVSELRELKPKISP